MAYSMTDVSGMSGVSLSELSHYAELGLLSPAFRGLDEDMYYEKELLTLQQILFCKEAGVAEEEIGSMLKEEPLEIIRVMRQHRIRLLEEALRLHGLIQTLDRTVSYLQGEQTMEEHELYYGFAHHTRHTRLPEANQTKHMPETFPTRDSKAAEKIELKSKEDFLDSQTQIDQVHLDLKQAMERGLEPGSPAVQQIIGRHLEWIKGYYTPTAEIYRDLANLYVEHRDFRNMYDGYHPRLAEFLREGMIIKASQELS